jgi:hypothetical protein
MKILKITTFPNYRCYFPFFGIKEDAVLKKIGSLRFAFPPVSFVCSAYGISLNKTLYPSQLS